MRHWTSALRALRTNHRPGPRHGRRLRLESLEDRCLLSGNNFLQTNLVSDLPGVAQNLDPNLVNPWGISESATSAFWIANNNSGTSTLYNTQGTPQSLVVSIPTPDDPLGSGGAATGTVFNGDANAFFVSAGDASAHAIFLFATEDGTIVGWNPGVNPVGSDPAKAGTFGTIAVDESTNPDGTPGAVYKGLTIATDPNSGQTLLYAANFRGGTVDVFDTHFAPAALPAGAFTDPNLPAGYAPFNVKEIGGKIYVTYALQNADKHDDVAGAHHGFVDAFNLDGSGGQRLVSGGHLNSPFGLVLAPAGFGRFGGDLLVGNFGDGTIHAYDPNTGAPLGELRDPDGEAIQNDGLWALKFGNGGSGGDAGTLYFTAGIDHENHGLFGSLTSVAAGTPEGPAEAQKVQAAVDVFVLDLNKVLQDLANHAPPATLTHDLQVFQTAVTDLIRAEIAFAADDHGDRGRHHWHHWYDLDD